MSVRLRKRSILGGVCLEDEVELANVFSLFLFFPFSSFLFPIFFFLLFRSLPSRHVFGTKGGKDFAGELRNSWMKARIPLLKATFCITSLCHRNIRPKQCNQDRIVTPRSRYHNLKGKNVPNLSINHVVTRRQKEPQALVLPPPAPSIC